MDYVYQAAELETKIDHFGSFAVDIKHFTTLITHTIYIVSYFSQRMKLSPKLFEGFFN